ncbi:MAG: hypothetical protein IKD69_12325 [Solobacterium sp.]|nr:hypothetical protein [Solobacterium sp.]
MKERSLTPAGKQESTAIVEEFSRLFDEQEVRLTAHSAMGNIGRQDDLNTAIHRSMKMLKLLDDCCDDFYVMASLYPAACRDRMPLS